MSHCAPHADKPLQTVCTKIRPDRTSSLMAVISQCTLKIFLNIFFKKTTKISKQNRPVCSSSLADQSQSCWGILHAFLLSVVVFCKKLFLCQNCEQFRSRSGPRISADNTSRQSITIISRTCYIQILDYLCSKHFRMSSYTVQNGISIAATHLSLGMRKWIIKIQICLLSYFRMGNNWLFKTSI